MKCSSTSFVKKKPSNSSDNVPDLDKATTLKVHFKELTCIKYRRDMYMTWDGLLAAFGGIFGLCLGGSVISLVEMAYYFTLRLYNRVHSLWRQTDAVTRPASLKALAAPAPSRKSSVVVAAAAVAAANTNRSSRLLFPPPAFVHLSNDGKPIIGAGIGVSKLQSFDDRKGVVELGLGGPMMVAKGRGTKGTASGGNNVFTTINERTNVGQFLR